MTDRALFHADNAYYYPAVRVNSLPLLDQHGVATRRFAASAARRA